MTDDHSTNNKPTPGLHSLINQCIPGFASKNGRIILDCDGETHKLLQAAQANAADTINGGLLGIGALLLHVGINSTEPFPTERLAEIGELIQTLAECRMSLDQLNVVFEYAHE